MESIISANHFYINTSNKGVSFEYSTSDDDDRLSSWDLYNEDDSLFPFSSSGNSSECDDNDNHNHNHNKRRKIKAAVVDEELEDTASSPDHTPKANNFSHLMYMNYSKAMEMIMNTTPTAPFFQVEGGDSSGKGSNEDEDAHELRKKGLCLVPLSLLFHNYI